MPHSLIFPWLVWFKNREHRKDLTIMLKKIIILSKVISKLIWGNGQSIHFYRNSYFFSFKVICQSDTAGYWENWEEILSLQTRKPALLRSLKWTRRFVKGRETGAMRQNRGQKMEDSASVKVLWNLLAVSILSTCRGKGKKALAFFHFQYESC